MPEGILGTEFRDLARQRGVGLLLPGEGKWAETPKFGPVLDSGLDFARRRGWLPQVGKDSGDFAGDVGVMLSPTGWPNLPGLGARQWEAVTPHIGDDKLHEAHLFRGHIPRALDLGEMLEHNYNYNPNDLGHLQKLRQQFSKSFPGGWIVKDKGGFGSAADSLLTDRSPVQALKGQLTRFGGQMVQERKPLQTLPDWQQWLDGKLGDLAGTSQNLNRGTQEYRVHALDGKVVPYATLHRGSPTQAILERWLPFRTRRIRDMETAVQKALDAARQRDPASIKDTFHGFDVGLGHNNKPFIIEANPSSMGTGSGMLTDPQVQDALSAAVKGRLPAHVLARRAAWGGGAAAGGAALWPEKEEEPGWRRWLHGWR